MRREGVEEGRGGTRGEGLGEAELELLDEVRAGGPGGGGGPAAEEGGGLGELVELGLACVFGVV